MAEIDIILDDEAWASEMSDPEDFVRNAVEATLIHAVGVVAQASLEVAVVLANDDMVQDLNRRFRGKDAPTNVLSFPADFPAPVEGPIGDVILARETCAREAREQSKRLDQHAAHLIVHGVLHLLGRDHEAHEAAEQMEREEKAVLAKIGIPDPYLAEASDCGGGGPTK